MNFGFFLLYPFVVLYRNKIKRDNPYPCIKRPCKTLFYFQLVAISQKAKNVFLNSRINNKRGKGNRDKKRKLRVSAD